jgi:hypothetical protein
MTYKTTEWVVWFGEYFLAHIEYNYVDGQSAGYYDAGWGGEADILKVSLQRELSAKRGAPATPIFEVTGEALWVFQNSEELLGACHAVQAQ